VSNRDLVRLVLANLSRMRARVALTAIGVIIGTAAIVVLISLGVGLQTSTTQEIGQFGDLTVIRVFAEAPFGFEDPNAAPARGPEIKLDARTLGEIAALPHVVAVTPEEGVQGGVELRYGRQSAFGNVVGIDPDAAPNLGWKVESGQARLGRGQVVIGPRVFGAEERPMFVSAAGPGARPVRPPSEDEAGPGPDQLQGRTLMAVLTKFDPESGEEVVRQERLRVAGVLEEAGGETDYSVYLALGDVEAFNQWFTGQRRNPREGYQNVVVKADDRQNVADVQRSLRAMGFENMFSAQDILQSINQVFVIIQAVLGGIGAIALLVAAFGIANTMTMAIYERTKEIGIMKAIGATNRDVLRIFLSEAGAIGLIGGVLGVALGWAVAKGLDLFFQAQALQSGNVPNPGEAPASTVVTPWWLMAFALAFAFFIGLASGIYPALRAASMKPLRALRTE
jgi:putative ABC transport system permease protein